MDIGLIGFDQFLNEGSEETKPTESRTKKPTWKLGQEFASHIEQVLNRHYDEEYSKELLGDDTPKKYKWVAVGDYWFNYSGKTLKGRSIRFITQTAERQIQFNWNIGNFESDNWDSVDIASKDGVFSFRINRSEIDVDGVNGVDLPNSVAVLLVLRLLNHPRFGQEDFDLQGDGDLNESVGFEVATLLSEARGSVGYGGAVSADRLEKRKADSDNKELKAKDKEIEKLQKELKKAKLNVTHTPKNAIFALDEMIADTHSAEEVAEKITSKFSALEKDDQRIMRAVLKTYLDTVSKKTTELDDSDYTRIEKIFELNKESVEDQMKRFVTALELMFSDDERGKKYCMIVSGEGGVGKSYLIQEFMEIVSDKIHVEKQEVTGSITPTAFLSDVRDKPNALFVFDDASPNSLPREGVAEFPEMFKNGVNSGTPYRCMTRNNMSTMKLYEYEEVYYYKEKGKLIQAEDKYTEGAKLYISKVHSNQSEIPSEWFSKISKAEDLGITDDELNVSEIPDLDTNFRGKDAKAKFDNFRKHLKRHYVFKTKGVKVIDGNRETELKDCWASPFSGKIIIITNRHQSEFDDAVIQRSYIIPVYSDPQRTNAHNRYILDSERTAESKGGELKDNPQWFSRYGHIYYSGGIRKKMSLTDDEVNEVVDYVEKLSIKMNMPVSSRIQKTILEYASVPNVNWEKYADVMMLQPFIGI